MKSLQFCEYNKEFSVAWSVVHFCSAVLCHCIRLERCLKKLINASDEGGKQKMQKMKGTSAGKINSKGTNFLDSAGASINMLRRFVTQNKAKNIISIIFPCIKVSHLIFLCNSQSILFIKLFIQWRWSHDVWCLSFKSFSIQHYKMYNKNINLYFIFLYMLLVSFV